MFTVEEAVLYIEAWGHLCFPHPDGKVTIYWLGCGPPEMATPSRVIELANEIWNANEGITNE